MEKYQSLLLSYFDGYRQFLRDNKLMHSDITRMKISVPQFNKYQELGHLLSGNPKNDWRYLIDAFADGYEAGITNNNILSDLKTPTYITPPQPSPFTNIFPYVVPFNNPSKPRKDIDPFGINNFRRKRFHCPRCGGDHHPDVGCHKRYVLWRKPKYQI